MKRLKHEADMLAADGGTAIFAELAQIDAGEQHAAGARGIESGEQCQQRGFTRAGRTDDGQCLAGSHTEAYIGENGEPSLGAGDGFGYILCFEND